MNRILQADVILTLTADQARGVIVALNNALVELPHATYELFELVIEQCAKQGVEL